MQLIRYPSKQYVEKFKEILYSLVLERVRSWMKILDIGCGKGTDLIRICEGKEVKGYGMDIDTAGLRNVLEKRGVPENIFFIQGDAEEIPCKDNRFDMIVFSEAIEHLHNVDKNLSEIHRVLKSGGVLFITTPSRYNYVTVIGRLLPIFMRERLRRIAYRGYNKRDGTVMLPNGRLVKAHVREFIPCELRKLLQRRGFRIENVRGGFLHLPVAVIFDNFYFLLLLWGYLDNFISRLPLSSYIKANFIVVATKNRL